MVLLEQKRSPAVMDDVISLSSDSGHEEDPDIQFVGSYRDDRTDTVPFIRAELLAVTPVLIDITGHQFLPLKPGHPQRSSTGQSTHVEVIDLNDDNLLSDSSNSDSQLQRITADRKLREAEHCVESSLSAVTKYRGNFQHSSRNKNLENDVIYLDPSDGSGPQSPLSKTSVRDKDSTDQYDSVHSCFEEISVQKKLENTCPCARDLFEIKAQELSDAFDNPHISPTQKLQRNAEELCNTKHPQQEFSAPGDHSTNQHEEQKETLDSPLSWLEQAPSPFSLDSPYYCPSEIDAVIFSDESNIADHKERSSTPWTLSSVQGTESASQMAVETTDVREIEHTHKSPTPQAQSKLPCETLSTSGAASPTSSLPCGQPCSPTSTEILAGDSPDTLASSPSLTMESPPRSPCLPSPLKSCTEKMFNGKGLWEIPPSSQQTRPGLVDEYIGPNEDPDCDESHTQDRQHISLVQFKKLKHLIGGGVQDVPEDDEEEEEDYGPAEPLCRQGLSLVYSTIEENYPEGTLQLLSDFIQPRYFPPADITSHLLRGILLDPQCSEVLAVEAYNLLMRTQKYHPADVSTVPWDWELLSTVMVEQGEASVIRSEVQCLLFQYVLKVLEDDFQMKLPMLRLHLSVAKAMVSCHLKFRQVRDVMNWLLDAAKQSYSNSEDDEMQERRKKCCLKMVLILQRMLLLAMEVDRTPTCSSNKLSQELCNSLNSTAPCRQLRLLLLRTLESNLLRCKLLELLLDQACSQKKPLPMSLKLLLHFLQTSTLPPDPTDGTERWRRWDELLKLVWMLMLSYEEVVTGHLRCSITERFTLSRAPMWTENDHLTRAAVQEAAEIFLSRAVRDLGHALPSQIQESLSQLQEHLLSICLH